jgi:hypothetical protein
VIQNNIAQYKLENRYVVDFLPSRAHNIYGLAFGFIGSEVVCDKFYTKKSHGLNVQIFGQGLFSPFYIFNKKTNFFYMNQPEIFYDDSLKIMRTKHNGIMISGFGTFTEHINGLSISPWMSVNHKVNGISINILANNSHTINGLVIGCYNSTYKTKGVQIGIINKTNKLKGFQIGLWNVNEKRKLPLLNWSFK